MNTTKKTFIIAVFALSGCSEKEYSVEDCFSSTVNEYIECSDERYTHYESCLAIADTRVSEKWFDDCLLACSKVTSGCVRAECTTKCENDLPIDSDVYECQDEYSSCVYAAMSEDESDCMAECGEIVEDCYASLTCTDSYTWEGWYACRAVSNTCSASCRDTLQPTTVDKTFRDGVCNIPEGSAHLQCRYGPEPDCDGKYPDC